MMPPLSLDDAQARLLESARPLACTRVPIDRATGYWLAEPIVAARTQPAADLSAMDGYAVAGDGPWTRIGESAAGRPYSAILEPGQCVRISTGALLPSGAEAVLLQEDARHSGGTIEALNPPSAGHIRRRGFDFGEGDPVLGAGRRMTPAALALAILSGATDAMVFRKPRVAVIDTGDELGPSGTRDIHRIPASNAQMIGALVGDLAYPVHLAGPVPDTRDALSSAFEAQSGADVIVSTGGASVGDHDLVRPVLAEWGATVDFWRVAIRPGKPLLFARRGDQWIVGLPGNPVSAAVTAILFVLPLLRRLAGAPHKDCLPRRFPVELAGDLPAGGPRREFLRARWSGVRAMPIAERDSSALRAFAAADMLIDRMIDAPAARAGETVWAIPIDGG